MLLSSCSLLWLLSQQMIRISVIRLKFYNNSQNCFVFDASVLVDSMFRWLRESDGIWKLDFKENKPSGRNKNTIWRTRKKKSKGLSVPRYLKACGTTFWSAALVASVLWANTVQACYAVMKDATTAACSLPLHPDASDELFCFILLSAAVPGNEKWSPTQQNMEAVSCPAQRLTFNVCAACSCGLST